MCAPIQSHPRCTPLFAKSPLRHPWDSLFSECYNSICLPVCAEMCCLQDLCVIIANTMENQLGFVFWLIRFHTQRSQCGAIFCWPRPTDVLLVSCHIYYIAWIKSSSTFFPCRCMYAQSVSYHSASTVTSISMGHFTTARDVLALLHCSSEDITWSSLQSKTTLWFHFRFQALLLFILEIL